MPTNSRPRQSKRFRDLERNIAKIERHLMPVINISGSYSEKEMILVRGYRLLIHAEIESYFETIAENKIRNVLSLWHINKKPSHVITSICAYFIFKSQNMNADIPESWDDTHRAFIEDRVENFFGTYIAILRQNNGITQKNLLKILLPLGIDINDLDITWLTDMDNFGEARGHDAHNTIGAQRPIDPATEKARIHRIINEIMKIDTFVRELK